MRKLILIVLVVVGSSAMMMGQDAPAAPAAPDGGDPVQVPEPGTIPELAVYAAAGLGFFVWHQRPRTKDDGI